MQHNMHNLMLEFGIQEIYQVRKNNLYPTTVLATMNGRDITVSHLLKEVTEIIKIIKKYFNVNEYQYSKAIIFLESLQLVLNRKTAKPPTKEDMHILVDVFREIKDMNAYSDLEKKKNEEIATALNYLIEILK